MLGIPSLYPTHIGTHIHMALWLTHLANTGVGGLSFLGSQTLGALNRYWTCDNGLHFGGLFFWRNDDARMHPLRYTVSAKAAGATVLLASMPQGYVA